LELEEPLSLKRLTSLLQAASAMPASPIANNRTPSDDGLKKAGRRIPTPTLNATDRE